MTVYVDSEANSFGRMIMCHMLADTEEELHEMADRIGMHRDWFQSPPKVRYPHYDLSKSKRGLAVKLGAIEVDRQGLALILKRLRGRMETGGFST